MSLGNSLFHARKQAGLSQEAAAEKLGVSRQTISKWEAGQSYPDFQRLVLLSDYFGMSLDELVKDIDVQDVRERNLTDERIASIFSDIQNLKSTLVSWWKVICYGALILIGLIIIGLIVKVYFPEIEWLSRTY